MFQTYDITSYNILYDHNHVPFFFLKKSTIYYMEREGRLW